MTKFGDTIHGNPVNRIRVGRNIDGYGLSPGITKQQRMDIEQLMIHALAKVTFFIDPQH